MATSVVTPVAGLVARAPETLTRRSSISSLACSRERARPRRTSSASSRRRRGGTGGSGRVGRSAPGRRLLARGPPQQVVGRLEDADVLLEGTLLEPLDRRDDLVDLRDAG